ncbi:hypothetical protein E5671_03980 [Streptomyces sp. BA2]|nr:nitroreductase family protein [Streptomyces sp. BA2]MWA08343.1 hypothetical protein [Streptomyces sp. BA2]
MPAFGDGVRAAGDIGMYAQNFLLSLTARGLGGIPQTMLGIYANTVREFLGVPDELTLLFGISFGTTDVTAPANSSAPKHQCSSALTPRPPASRVLSRSTVAMTKVAEHYW